jgi:hypothetical protein
MNLSTKIWIIIGALLGVNTLIFIGYTQYQITKRQDAIQTQMTEMKQLADNISRAQTNWATKGDLETIAKQNDISLQPIKDDLQTLKASLTAINVVSVQSGSQVINNVPSTSTTPNPNPSNTPSTNITNEYANNRQVLQLNEKFSNVDVPFGEVGFSSWQDKPWDLSIKSREYKVSTVLGTDKNQKQYAYNTFSIKVDNKEYPVKINSNNFSQEYPSPSFSFWNPRLYLGVNGGIDVNQFHGELTPDISVAFMSYGKYETQPDLSILQVGVGYGAISKRPQAVITPITYNVGQHIPLMTNLHVGPTLQLGTNGDITVGAGLKLGM